MTAARAERAAAYFMLTVGGGVSLGNVGEIEEGGLKN